MDQQGDGLGWEDYDDANEYWGQLYLSSDAGLII